MHTTTIAKWTHKWRRQKIAIAIPIANWLRTYFFWRFPSQHNKVSNTCANGTVGEYLFPLEASLSGAYNGVIEVCVWPTNIGHLSPSRTVQSSILMSLGTTVLPIQTSVHFSFHSCQYVGRCKTVIDATHLIDCFEKTF